VAEPGERVPMTTLGHVTSAYLSPNLDRAFALALVEGGRGRIGQKLYVPLLDRLVAVTVTEPVFIDPEGARLHG
jgi:sarcosine oxidase subunit alpha